MNIRLIVISIFALMIAIVAGYYAMNYFSDSSEAKNTAEKIGKTDQEESKSKKIKKEEVPFYDMQAIIVDIASGTTSDKKRYFLKLLITIELVSKQEKVLIKRAMPRILDSLNVYLRGVTVVDINNASGIYRLKEECLLRISKALGNDISIADVLFRDIVIQ